MAVRSCSRSPLRREGTVHPYSPPMCASRLPQVGEMEKSIALAESLMERALSPPKLPLSSARRSRSPSSSPTRTGSATSSDRMSRLRRPRQRPAARPGPALDRRWSSRIASPTPTCTPTPTPAATPGQTPTHTPVVTPTRRSSSEVVCATVMEGRSCFSSESFAPANGDDGVVAAGRLKSGLGFAATATTDSALARGGRAMDSGTSKLPPVPAFTSRFIAALPTAVPATCVRAMPAGSTQKMADDSRQFSESESQTGPFAEHAGVVRIGDTVERMAKLNCINGGVVGELEEARKCRRAAEARRRDTAPKEETTRVMPSIETEVDIMFDDSTGTLRLSRDDLGDERVPSLSLPQLREAYRTGTGILRSWTTVDIPLVAEKKADESTSRASALVEVEHERMGVLSSTDAFLFLFVMKPSHGAPLPTANDHQNLAGVPEEPLGDDSPHTIDSLTGLWAFDRIGSDSAAPESNGQETATGAPQEEDESGFCVVYVWLGREVDTGARAAARAEGQRLRTQHGCASSPPALEVEQGCEPALFLALFSYMQPPLAAVVLQGRDEKRELRVLELQESPCFPEAGIAFAVEGDASLLAKHGPLPGRSYVILVRPSRRRRKGGSGGGRSRGSGSSSDRGSSGSSSGGAGLAAFDAGYYWHGVGEKPAVEGVGILLCQQVERMFPPVSAVGGGLKRKGSGRRRRVGGVAGGFGMMRGFVADVKLGLPVPEGFWACIFSGRSSLSSMCSSVEGPEERALLSQDLHATRRTRPVRVFGVCAESRKAGQRFIWEVTAGGMPSQMRLSPSLSHVVDGGGSVVYVWHGAGSHGDGRRLACHVARVYAHRVEGGATVEEADTGSEPPLLLNCFIGWDQALVEPPLMLSYSPPGQNCVGNGKHQRYSMLSSLSSQPPPTASSTTTSSRVSSPHCPEAVKQGHEYCDQSQRRRYGSRGSTGSSMGRNAELRKVSNRASLSPSLQSEPPHRRTPTLDIVSPPSLRTLRAETVAPCPTNGGGDSEAAKDSCDAVRAAFSPIIVGSSSLATIETPLWRRCIGPTTQGAESASVTSNVGRSLASSMKQARWRTPQTQELMPTPVSACEAPSGRQDPVAVEEKTTTLRFRCSDGGKYIDVECLGDGNRCVTEARHGKDGVTIVEGARGGGTSSGGAHPSGESNGGGSDQGNRNDESGNGDDDRGMGAGGRRGGGDGFDGGEGGAGDGDDDGSGRQKGMGADVVDTEDNEDDSDNDEGGDSFLRSSGPEYGSSMQISAASYGSSSAGNGGRRMFDSRGSLVQPGRATLAQATAADFSSGYGNSNRFFDSGESDGQGPPRRLSAFFRSPQSLDRRPLKLERSSSANSLPDVDMLARIYDTTKSFGSEYSSRNSSMLFKRSSSSGVFDSPQQQMHTRTFDSRMSCDSSEKGRDGSFIWLHRGGVSGVLDNSPQQPIPVSGDLSLTAGLPPRAPATSPPTITAFTAEQASISTIPKFEVGSHSLGVYVDGDVATGRELLSSAEPRAPVTEMYTESGSFTASAADDQGINLAKSGTEVVGDEGESGRDKSQSSGRESEEEWLAHDPDALGTNNAVVEQNGEKSVGGHNDRRSTEELRAQPSALTTRHEGEHAEALLATNRSCIDSHVVRGDIRSGSACGTVTAFEDRRWVGLDEDGSWRSEVCRIAAGAAGAEEAERRRLAKVREDESWRLEAKRQEGSEGARDVRRQSVSFTRVQDGNVRNKLSMFEHTSGGRGEGTAGKRTSIGALKGLGLVKARSKKLEHRCPSSIPTALLAAAMEEDQDKVQNDDHNSGSERDSSSSEESDDEALLAHPVSQAPGSNTQRSRSRKSLKDRSKKKKEFLWKEGPSPPPLPSRPSLGLIRHGQVRILSKALLLACPEGVDDTHEHQNGAFFFPDGSAVSSSEPPMTTTPPPPPTPPRPAHLFSKSTPDTTSSPLPQRSTSTVTPPPKLARRTADSPNNRGTPSPSSHLTTMWGPRIGRKNDDRCNANAGGNGAKDHVSPVSSPSTPGKYEGRATRTPTPTTYLGLSAGGSGDAVARAAGVGGARAVWMKLRRKPQEDAKIESVEINVPDSVPTGVSSGR